MPGTVTCSFIGSPQWQTQPLNQAMAKDAVTVWHGSALALLPFYDSCYALLNKAEKGQAARFYQVTDRQRYVIQHGLLRYLLAGYLSTWPADLEFTFNPNKKPYLAGKFLNQYYFNLSRAGGEFLIALGGTELGVDLERIKPDFDYHAIATTYFGRNEVAYINGATMPSEAFFLLWARKEALLKACGMGIDDNLPAVPALDGKHSLPEYYPAKDYHTQSFTVGNGLMGSITMALPPQNISFIKIDAEMLNNRLLSYATAYNGQPNWANIK